MLPVSLDCFCFVCLRLVYPMLPVSLECFVDRCLSFYPFSFCHFVVCPSLICGF
jgi:hypothetical protein